MILRQSFGIGLVVACALLVLPVSVHAFDVPPNDGFVTDAAGVITPAQDAELETILKAYRDGTSNEIAVVIIRGLGGQPVEDVALEIGRKWGVGAKSKDNGILMLFSLEERDARIEVGYGLEGAVPDIIAKGIIETDIAPHFRDGDYSGGIAAAVDSLKKHIGGEYTADRYVQKASTNVGGYTVFFVLILLQWLLAILGRTKSWWLGGVLGGVGGVVLTGFFGWWLSIPLLILIGLFLDFVVSKNYSRRGPTSWWAGGGGFGGGGGGGGGGFGGFSGGGFGGGGASGKW